MAQLPVGAIAGAATWMLGLGAMGIVATDLTPWYYGLRKPEWKPSDKLFGPVWSTIFLLAAVAFVLAWSSPAADAASRSRLVLVYAVNAVLNVLWSWLFFRMRRPDLALIEVVPLWLSIAAMIWALRPLTPVGAWLLAPYLAWVSFATVLNRAIVRLNGPFGG
ncbi:MAG: tryptophan-rich sensory protein [Gemmatimonadales bacterium]|jgi:tryptophan-rich sensory protein|nr:tryptophan-rich sensory protein [Gemmatimonadales bacterium]